jgi:hypothetical protein
MVDKDEPEREPAASIEPQVTVIFIEVNGGGLPRLPPTIGHGFNLSRLLRPTIHVTDSAAVVFIRRFSVAGVGGRGQPATGK